MTVVMSSLFTDYIQERKQHQLMSDILGQH